MSSQTDIEKLIYTLRLTPYQAREIYLNKNRYNMARLEMRGNVLHAPCNGDGIVSRLINGRTSDVIGPRRVFLRGAHHVRVLSGGYYTGRIGVSVCYGDCDGRVISRAAFESATKRH